MSESSAESDVTVSSFQDTELTLRLPGHHHDQGRPSLSLSKRGSLLQAADLKRLQRSEDDVSRDSADGGREYGAPAAKAQAVGWPPVRCQRKMLAAQRWRYVKVAVDGAPYLRKVDLGLYGGYKELLRALRRMFSSSSCFPIHGNGVADGTERSKVEDELKGMEYVPTYEDKDGDWMLVGDVPWKMFIESCKRIRLMKNSDAKGLVPRAGSSTS